jgi:pyruvate/2-oxoglutarate dehydrogenase complex dihydrolipoamide dehydrogenase (E3) component
VVETARALASDDPEASAVVLKALADEGVEVREGARAERVEAMSGFVRVHVTTAAGTETVDGSHLLIAAGNRPDLSDLNLDAAGVKRVPGGIAVNRGLRTSNRRIYAIGDVTGGPCLTHLATYQGSIVLRRALFRTPAKADPAIVPRVTFTDPELAHVGLGESEARAAGYRICVLRWPFAENDRAETEHETAGHIKIVTTPKGRILGATIVGAGAGELIQVWALAVAENLPVKAMADFVAPYPTRGEITKRTAMRWYAPAASRGTVRKLIDFLARLG